MDIALSTGLDLTIIIIFILCISFGVNKGLIRSVISLFGKIFSLIIAFIFSENLGLYIDQTYVHAPLRQWLINELSPTADNVKATLTNLDIEALFRDKPEFFTNISKFLGFDVDTLFAQYNSICEQSVDQAKAAVTDAMISPLSAIVSRVIAFALIFILCCIAVAILWWLSDFIINLPIIRHLDKLGGAAVGIVNAFLLSFIAVSVISLGSHYFMKDRTLESQQRIEENTVIYKYFNEYNPFKSIFNEWE